MANDGGLENRTRRSLRFAIFRLQSAPHARIARPDRNASCGVLIVRSDPIVTLRVTHGRWHFLNGRSTRRRVWIVIPQNLCISYNRSVFAVTLAAGMRLGADEVMAQLGIGGMGDAHRARYTKRSDGCFLGRLSVEETSQTVGWLRRQMEA